MSRANVYVSVSVGNKRGRDKKFNKGYQSVVHCRAIANEINPGGEASVTFYTPSLYNTSGIFGELTVKMHGSTHDFMIVGGSVDIQYLLPVPPMEIRTTELCFDPSDVCLYTHWMDRESLLKIMYYVSSPYVERSAIGISTPTKATDAPLPHSETLTPPAEEKRNYTHALLWKVKMSATPAPQPPEVIRSAFTQMAQPNPLENPICSIGISLALRKVSGPPLTVDIEQPSDGDDCDMDHEEGQDAKRAHY